jgi:hypothetical protein
MHIWSTRISYELYETGFITIAICSSILLDNVSALFYAGILIQYCTPTYQEKKSRYNHKWSTEYTSSRAAHMKTSLQLYR